MSPLLKWRCLALVHRLQMLPFQWALEHQLRRLAAPPPDAGAKTGFLPAVMRLTARTARKLRSISGVGGPSSVLWTLRLFPPSWKASRTRLRRKLTVWALCQVLRLAVRCLGTPKH
jgi:hypothetical protein